MKRWVMIFLFFLNLDYSFAAKLEKTPPFPNKGYSVSYFKTWQKDLQLGFIAGFSRGYESGLRLAGLAAGDKVCRMEKPQTDVVKLYEKILQSKDDQQWVEIIMAEEYGYSCKKRESRK